MYTTNRTSDAPPTFDFSIAPSTNDVTRVPAEPLRAELQRRAALQPLPGGAVLAAGASASATATAPTPTSPPARRSSPSATRPPSSPASTTTRPTSTTAPIPRTATTSSSPTSLSYFLSTGSLGRHDLKGGFEYYRSHLKGGNSQSPTSFVYYADYKTNDAGDPVLDASGNLTPVFITEGGLFLNWLAERGAILNVNTTTLYLNDRWTLNNHWGFNLGLRYEQVRSDTTSPSISGIDTTTLVPRLGVDFDPTGTGSFKLQGTYSHYAASYNPGQFGNNQGAGNPSLVYGIYIGPPGEGLGFAPGFDPAELRAAGRAVAHRQRLLRGRAVLAAGEGVDALRRHPDRQRRLRQGDLREPQGRQLRGELHHLRPRDGRGHDAVHVPGLRGPVPARPHGVPEQRPAAAGLPGAPAQRRLSRRRALEPAGELHVPDPQPRQLRGREHRTSRPSRPPSATTPRSWCPSAISPKGA